MATMSPCARPRPRSVPLEPPLPALQALPALPRPDGPCAEVQDWRGLLRRRRRWHRRLSSVLLAAVLAHCFCCEDGRAQSPGDFDLGLTDRWRWHDFDAASGIPDARVREVEEGTDGRLWIGTDNGLFHYDGFRFHPVDGPPRGVPTSLAPLPGGVMAAQWGGVLWIGDATGWRREDTSAEFAELALQPRRIVRQLRTSDSGQLLVELRDDEGTFVVAAKDGHDPRSPWRRVPLPAEVAQRPSNHTDPHRGRSSLLVLRGCIVEATEGGRRWDVPEEWTITGALPDPAKNGALLVVSLPWDARGVWEVSDRGRARVPHTESESYVAYDVSPSGEVLLVSTDGRCTTRHPTLGWSAPFPAPDRLVEAPVVRFLQSGDLVLASRRGLAWVQRAGSPWEDQHGAKQNSSHNMTFCLHVARDGSVWRGSAAGIERRHPGGSVEFHDELAGVTLRDVTACIEDAEGTLWFGSGAGNFLGLIAYRPTDGHAVHHHGPDLPAAVHALALDGEQRLLAAALPAAGSEGGLWRLGANGWERGEFAGLVGEATRTYAVAVGQGDELWVGTTSGLYRGPLHELRPVASTPEVRAARVYTLIANGDGGVWFGHGRNMAGLGHASRTGAVTYQVTLDGRAEPRVVALTRDVDGRIWVGSSDELLVVAEGALRRIYGRSLALSALTVLDGKVLVGTWSDGIAVYDPERAAAAEIQVELGVDVVARGTAVARWVPRARWNAVPSARVLTRVRFDDGAWTPWSMGRELRRADLPAGARTCRVEVLGAHQATPVATVTQRFDIPRPVWARLEVALPCGLALGGALAALLWTSVRWSRERRVRHLAEVRQQRLSLELDHRVKNVLAQVAALAEQSLQRSADMSSFAHAFLGRIRSMARTHEALASNRWDGVPLGEVVRTALGPTVDGRCSATGPTVVLSPRVSSSLGLALHELGTNAVKHGALAGEDGCVDVTWSVEGDGRIDLEWRELGGTEPPSRKSSGMGLSLVHGLIGHDLGGEVRIAFPPAGLVCRMSLPNAIADPSRGATSGAGPQRSVGSHDTSADLGAAGSL